MTFKLRNSWIMVLLFLNMAWAQEMLPPSEVQNLKGVANKDSITLTWDEATDTDGIIINYKIYYGTRSVQGPEDSYDDEIITENSDTTYTLENLEKGVDYYFTVTAIDDFDIESETYSTEIKVSLAGGDGKNFKVSEVEQIKNNTIKVFMSNAVAPISFPEAFIIENSSTLEVLDIDQIETDGKIVTIVSAEDFMPKKKYRIIATSAVTDTQGNPISSGVMDNIEFVAQHIAESQEYPETLDPPRKPPVDIEPPNEDDIFGPQIFPGFGSDDDKMKPVAPVIDTTPPVDATNLEADTSRIWDENIVVFYWEKSVDVDGDVMDQVLYARIDGGDWDSGYSIGKNLEVFEFITEPNKNYEVKITTQDVNGNESPGISTTFSSVRPDVAISDTTAPLNPMNLKVDSSQVKTTKTVHLTWEPALDVDDDIVDQVLYVKKGMGVWEETEVLGKETEKYELSVEPDQTYEVKIITVDSSGNTSSGALAKFSTSMSQSGPGTVVALLLASVVGGLYFYRRRQIVY